MDAWERGSTLMHGCKCEGKHAQQHITAHDRHIAGRSPQPKDQTSAACSACHEHFQLARQAYQMTAVARRRDSDVAGGEPTRSSTSIVKVLAHFVHSIVFETIVYLD